jgi:selenide,water dikinase
MYDMEIDLLKYVDQGGCSAKLPAEELSKALAGLTRTNDNNILVDIDTHDDGGVYRIREDYALIQTTDFFPPVCSDPYDFGQIAAANALSDVYAMGGQVLTALNLVLFPANIPLSALKRILQGGQDKVHEAGGTILGGHTIADDIPKYGLAVTGFVHPDHVVTNSNARPGDVIILTKPIGTGIIISARKNHLAPDTAYKEAIANMKLLNDRGAAIMNRYGIKSATDITGFGLLGHAKKMAEGSNVCIHIESGLVPHMTHVHELIEMGCIPGAAFRNQEFCESGTGYEKSVGYNLKMLLLDAQTSGGLLMCVKPGNAEDVLNELKTAGYPASVIIGEVTRRKKHLVSVG